MDVTRESLASALEGFYVTVRSSATASGGHTSEIRDPDETAEALYATLGRMAALREQPCPCPWCRGAPFVRTADCTCATSCGADHCCPDGTVVDAAPKWIEITRDELAALLTKLRLGIEQAEEWRFGPTAKLSRPEAVADAIASHARGLRAAETADVVDAHICCEHAGIDDAELAAMAAIITAMNGLDERAFDLGTDACQRVVRWATARWNVPSASS